LISVFIMGLVWLNFVRKTYYQAIRDKDSIQGSSKYYGRQELTPPSGSLWDGLYTTDQVDDDENDIHVCPYGCRLQVSDTLPGGLPSNTTINDMDIFPTPTNYPECGDTRSFFSFTSSLYPDARVKIDTYDHNDPDSISEWIVHQGDKGVNHICPKKQEYTRWPYDSLCKDKRNQCLAMDTYGVATPSQPVLGARTPTPSDQLDVRLKGSGFKELLNETCLAHENEYGECDVWQNSGLSIDYDDSDGITKTLKIDCSTQPAHDNDYCPFPENSAYLEGVDGPQRQPIKLWQELFSSARPTRRLGESEKLDWQNQERYDIVDQNFMVDRN